MSVVWIRWPVALTEATFQLQNRVCSYSTISKGSQTPMAVNTRPLDPLRIKRSANSTLFTVGPHRGHWTVSVITFYTEQGEALYSFPMLIRFEDMLITSSCAFFNLLMGFSLIDILQPCNLYKGYKQMEGVRSSSEKKV